MDTSVGVLLDEDAVQVVVVELSPAQSGPEPEVAALILTSSSYVPITPDLVILTSQPLQATPQMDLGLQEVDISNVQRGRGATGDMTQ